MLASLITLASIISTFTGGKLASNTSLLINNHLCSDYLKSEQATAVKLAT